MERRSEELKRETNLQRLIDIKNARTTTSLRRVVLASHVATRSIDRGAVR